MGKKLSVKLPYVISNTEEIIVIRLRGSGVEYPRSEMSRLKSGQFVNICYGNGNRTGHSCKVEYLQTRLQCGKPPHSKKDHVSYFEFNVLCILKKSFLSLILSCYLSNLNILAKINMQRT